MSLTPILKHVYNHGSDEVIRRGKRIFHAGGVQLQDVDHLQGIARFRVRNDQYYNHYIVTVNKFSDPKALSLRCQCPYNLGDICRHEVAALFFLNELVLQGRLDSTPVTYNQQHTTLRIRDVSEEALIPFLSPEAFAAASDIAAEEKFRDITVQDDTITALLPEEESIGRVIIRLNEDRNYDTSCGCDETQHPLCRHKAGLIMQVLRTQGPSTFKSLHNKDALKAKLLQQYGYTLQDDLTGKFEFIYPDGKPVLRVLDNNIRKVDAKDKPSVTNVAIPAAAENEAQRLAIIFKSNTTLYPHTEFSLAAAQEDQSGKLTGTLQPLQLRQYISAAPFKEEDRDLIPIIRKFLPEELAKYVRKASPFGDFIDNSDELFKGTPSAEIKEALWEYLLPKYGQLLQRYKDFTHIYTAPDKGTPTVKQLKPLAFSDERASLRLHIAPQPGGKARITAGWNIAGSPVQFGDATHPDEGLLLYADTLYALKDLHTLQLAMRFDKKGLLNVSAKEWPVLLRKEVLQWSQLHEVTFAKELIAGDATLKMHPRIYLEERNGHLVLRPAFMYGETEIRYGHQGKILVPDGPLLRTIGRNEEAELAFLEMLRQSHTDMQMREGAHFLTLRNEEVLRNSWFLQFAEEMQRRKVDMLGMQQLQSLRINTHRPQTAIRMSSDIDWFDARIDVMFGDQRVSIDDVKKAISSRQNYVQLADGTLGMLPNEWLKKYALAIKVGDVRGGSIRLKKTQASVLDTMLAEIDDEQTAEELEARKERLTQIIEQDFSSLLPSENLKATLRPYQLAGFQWLAFLKESGWGGILADDMGLGKTVQSLAWFQHYKEQNKEAKFLVVCPTTLIYNWESEIKKFTPELSYHIHHGPKRSNGTATLREVDVIITTYGTMRSDIKLLRTIEFDYVVLDESQAIKNAQSLVAKAALLVNAKHKLALSGTPVQNNTFDLFSQMNFLNPGLLGSREFFMNEFAVPIDKFGESEVKQQLRQLTYPFMLRRTKEQVARDLPPKTETVLYCEMGADQRRIYDAYRNTYRSEILGMIDKQGMERSQFHILQGLTKLRQICDSPAILNEDERYPNHSVKQDELMRELAENVGEHKVLIFSQFLGMLSLLRKNLDEEQIPYAYFDGSSSAVQREQAVQSFQKDASCRVFLISLKAGGVGLNLTAADYVYIVDPWWNPAVEQQAIDRTHRIGQTKNIFAYRLICKDTIEEKILELQERKRALAADLVGDDTALLKKLTREDIEYLLS